MNHVGEAIRRAREDRGLSQEWVASEAGISVRQLSKIENGGSSPSVDTATRIAKAIGMEELPMPGGVSLIRPTIRWGDHFDVVDPNPRWSRRKIEAEVSAGPGGWDDNVDGNETIDVPEVFMGPNYMVLKARGESMVDENIHDGDYLIVERRPNGIAANEELVIAWLNDGLVVKKWGRRRGKKTLYSANPNWPERPITEDDVFEIQGVVRYIINSRRRIS